MNIFMTVVLVVCCIAGALVIGALAGILSYCMSHIDPKEVIDDRTDD